MTKAETVKMLSMLHSVWSHVDLSEKRIAVYHAVLSHLTFEDASRAAISWIATGKYFPVPSELLELVAEKETSGLTAGDSWENALRFVRRYGFSDGPEHLNELDPITKETIRQIGWRRFCLDDNSKGYIRRDWDQAFATVAQRHKKDIQTGLVELAASSTPAIAP